MAPLYAYMVIVITGFQFITEPSRLIIKHWGIMQQSNCGVGSNVARADEFSFDFDQDCLTSELPDTAFTLLHMCILPVNQRVFFSKIR